MEDLKYFKSSMNKKSTTKRGLIPLLLGSIVAGTLLWGNQPSGKTYQVKTPSGEIMCETFQGYRGSGEERALVFDYEEIKERGNRKPVYTGLGNPNKLRLKEEDNNNKKYILTEEEKNFSWLYPNVIVKAEMCE